MSKRYIGHLPGHDPLHHYLQYDILPQIGLDNHHARFRVFRMSGSNEVYMYEEKHSHVQVVGKFFAGNGHGVPICQRLISVWSKNFTIWTSCAVMDWSDTRTKSYVPWVTMAG